MMTKKETAEIIKLLNAYFPNKGTATVATMIDAWHEALKDEDFKRTRKAVVEFAKNDRREYPTWPGVGQIIGKIEDVKKAENRHVIEAYNGIYNHVPYNELGQEVRDRLTPEKYAEFSRIDPETVGLYGKEIRAKLKIVMRAEE